MADYYPGFLTEWQTAINVVWPEIILPGGASPSNFFTALQALKTNLEQKLEDASPAPPYCLLALGQFMPMMQTMDRNDKNAPVTLFYLDTQKNGATQTTINAKLKLIDDYMRIRNTTTFCLMSEAIVDSSDLNPVNAVLATKSGMEVIGGTITWPSVYLVALS